MATNLGRMVTYLDGVVFQDHETKTKIIIYPLSQLVAMATKLGRVVINLKAALSDLRQFLTADSPLKMVKKAFYFTSKALFVLLIFKFLS